MFSVLLIATAVSAATCPFTRTPNPPLALFARDTTITYRSLTIQPSQIGQFQTSSEILFGNFEAMYSTTDNAKTFKKFDLPSFTNSWGGFKTSAGTYLVVSPTDMFRKTTQSAWEKVDLPKVFGAPISSTGLNSIIEVNGQLIFGTQSGMFVSQDDGITWAPINCLGLIPLAVNNNTITDCDNLFVRGMMYSKDDNKIIVAVGAVGLSGLYSVQLPVPVGTKSQPQWDVVFGSQLCDMEVQSDGTTLCTDHGPMVLKDGFIYAQTGRNLAKIPYPGGKDSPKNYVFTSANYETASGIAFNENTFVAAFFNQVVISKDGNTWTRLDTSACNPPFLFPKSYAQPKFYTGGVAAMSDSKFLVGGELGPFILTV